MIFELNPSCKKFSQDRDNQISLSVWFDSRDKKLMREESICVDPYSYSSDSLKPVLFSCFVLSMEFGYVEQETTLQIDLTLEDDNNLFFVFKVCDVDDSFSEKKISVFPIHEYKKVISFFKAYVSWKQNKIAKFPVLKV